MSVRLFSYSFLARTQCRGSNELIKIPKQQLEMTIRFHISSVRMVSIKKQDKGNNKHIVEKIEKRGILKMGLSRDSTVTFFFFFWCTQSK